MSALARRGATLGLAVSLLVGCNDTGVSGLTWHSTEAELSLADAHGYPARVVIGGSPRPTSPEETLIVLGDGDLAVLPGARFTEFARAGFRDYLFRRWVGPYLAVHDLDGAVRAATAGYLLALRAEHRIPMTPALAPVPDPNEWAFTFPSENADWGLPFSATICMLGIALSVMAKRRAART